MNFKGIGILLVLWGIWISGAVAQKFPTEPDSVLRKKSVVVHDVTPLVYLPDSLIRDSLVYEYTKIKDFAYKKRWTKELYKMFFINPRRGRVNVLRTQNSEARFKEYQGKIIRKISVKILPPYGTSVYDTTYLEEDLGWLKEIANSTHMSTAERVIFRQLTFKPGMVLNSFELVQNEILLRELDYIDDVSISVTEDSVHSDFVHVLVICKDQLSWSGKVESNFINSFELGVENKNFMKLGHVLNYNISYRGSKEKKWGNILEYKINSIWGSYINVRGYYQNDYREKEIRLELEKPFLTSQIKWAGGIDIGRMFYSEELPDRNVTRLEELFNYHFHDFWFGRSFKLSSRSTFNRNIFWTNRLFTTIFHNRPLVSDDTNQLYHNRIDFLTALTFVKIKYYKANLIYDFGRTEDIPVGVLINVTGGYEKSEYDQFGYFGTEARYSHFNQYSKRYYDVGIAFNSYINGERFERGVLKIEGNHISSLYNLGDLKYRFYNTVRYVQGINRYDSDYLYLEDYDIRGFSSDSLRGYQKLSMSIATTFFLPHIKKGFRIATSCFVDAGVLAPNEKSLFSNKVYWGVGIGLNLRNDNVILKNLHFRLTFYPTLPADGRHWQVLLNNSRHGRFYDYRVAKPQVIQYE